MWGYREDDLELTLPLVQYWGVSSGGTVATWYIAAGSTPHQSDASQHTISTRVFRVHITV